MRFFLILVALNTTGCITIKNDTLLKRIKVLESRVKAMEGDIGLLEASPTDTKCKCKTKKRRRAK